jgi:hypothetical protein
MTTNKGETEVSDSSYVDYEIFLAPDFSAPNFANTIVLTTNNPTDTPLDLATPLSKVLFDIQEVDSHIHTLTSTSALPLLSHTQSQTAASSHIVAELSGQAASLNDSYQRLEKEIIGRYEAAEEVRRVSERLWQTVRLGRSVGRALQLGRQLEVQMSELSPSATTSTTTTATTAKTRDDHRAMVRASNTILTLRTLFAASGPGGEGEGLAKVHVVSALRNDLIIPAERTLRTKAQQIVREFSMSTLSNSTTYAQIEDTKSRTTSALLTLYLLSSLPSVSGKAANTTFNPEVLISSLQDYIQTALTSSHAALVRSLGALPTLDNTLREISARCQNIIALEALLESIKPPALPVTSGTSISTPTNFLRPLLATLETSSLPSHFWRSLGSTLSPRVQELVSKGGVQARTLRTNKSSVRDAIRDCVLKGSQPPAGSMAVGASAGKLKKSGGDGWEREVAVMVGAVTGHLGR